MQVTAEVIASNGDTVISSSQPCMLRFRSFPVRIMRTFIMSIPLLLGICSESQDLALEILRYKESNLKPTQGMRVRLTPRAGTSDLPQIYEAEIIVKSQLPRRKEIVYNWKWTFYVWISLYVYIMLLIVLACCFRPFSFPRRSSYQVEQPEELETDEQSDENGELSEEFSDALRRWRERSRDKMKVQLRQAQQAELIEMSASSATGGQQSEVIQDSGDCAASESSEYCRGG